MQPKNTANKKCCHHRNQQHKPTTNSNRKKETNLPEDKAVEERVGKKNNDGSDLYGSIWSHKMTSLFIWNNLRTKEGTSEKLKTGV